MKPITIRLSDAELMALQECINRGNFKNRSHAISAALRLLAEEHHIPPAKMVALRTDRRSRRRRY